MAQAVFSVLSQVGKTRGHDVRRGRRFWVYRLLLIKTSCSEVSNH